MAPFLVRPIFDQKRKIHVEISWIKLISNNNNKTESFSPTVLWNNMKSNVVDKDWSLVRFEEEIRIEYLSKSTRKSYYESIWLPFLILIQVITTRGVNSQIEIRWKMWYVAVDFLLVLLPFLSAWTIPRSLVVIAVFQSSLMRFLPFIILYTWLC